MDENDIIPPGRALGHIRETLYLLREEKQAAQTIFETYGEASALCASQGDMLRARRFAALGIGEIEATIGEFCPVLPRYREWEAHPARHEYALRFTVWAPLPGANPPSAEDQMSEQWLWENAEGE